METIKNMVGLGGRQNVDQGGEEPVSGERGVEAYDAGNEPTSEETTANTTSDSNTFGDSRDTTMATGGSGTSQTNQENTSTSTSDNQSYDKNTSSSINNQSDQDNTTSNSSTNQSSNTNPTSGVDGGINTASTNNPNQGPIRPEHETDKTGVTSLNKPSSAFSDNKPTSSEDRTVPGAQPSVGADPTGGSGAQDGNTGQQGADRPHDEPTREQRDAVKGSKEKAEAAQAGDNKNPEDATDVDISGPGPKPVSERKQDGGADTEGPPKPAGGDDDGPQKESHGEGTGEKWVKTSGMKADGGDFDAAQAGAGKEADRLLEEKGIHHTAPGEPAAGKDAAGGKDAADTPSSKPSLKEKIKAKFGK